MFLNGEQIKYFAKTMLRLLEDLPVELVGTNVFSYLSLKDVVMLERACGSEKSHQAFMEQIPHSPSVELSYKNHTNMTALSWCANRQCKIYAGRTICYDQLRHVAA